MCFNFLLSIYIYIFFSFRFYGNYFWYRDQDSNVGNAGLDSLRIIL